MAMGRLIKWKSAGGYYILNISDIEPVEHDTYDTYNIAGIKDDLIKALELGKVIYLLDASGMCLPLTGFRTIYNVETNEEKMKIDIGGVLVDMNALQVVIGTISDYTPLM